MSEALVLLGVCALAIGMMCFSTYRAGRDAMKADIERRVTDAANTRAQVENDNARLTDDDLRAKLLNGRR